MFELGEPFHKEIYYYFLSFLNSPLTGYLFKLSNVFLVRL